MSRPLPDCGRCDAVQTLEMVRVEPGGVTVAICSCCAGEVRLRLASVAPPPPVETDLRGHVVEEK